MRGRFDWSARRSAGFALVAVLLPTSAGAVQITPQGGFDWRGAEITRQHCLEYDPGSTSGDCVRADFVAARDRAEPGEIVFATTQTLPGPASPFAQHESEITSTSLSGSGSISLESQIDPDYFVDATSSFELSFSIDERAGYHLAAILRRPPLDGSPAIGSGFARLELCTAFAFGCSSVIVRELLRDEPLFEVQLDESGVLDPGAYYLRVTAGSQGQALGSHASYEFALVLTNVPEPATSRLIFGAAIAWAALRRRPARYLHRSSRSVRAHCQKK